MSLKTAIKKAAAAVQAAVLPHENPAPVAGTTVSQVVPAVPEEDSGAHAAHEAGRIHRQLTEAQQQDQYKLDGETRRRIIEALNAFGPPKNAFLENQDTGACFNFDGTPADLGQYEIERPVRVRDTASDEVVELVNILEQLPTVEPQRVTGANRRMTRAEYLEYQRKRK